MTRWEKSALISITISPFYSSACERIRAYIKINREAIKEGSQLCLCVAYCLGRDSLKTSVLDKLNAYNQAVADWLTKVFALGQKDGSIVSVGEPQNEANACLAQVEGAQLLARAATNGALFDNAVAALEDRLKI